MKAYRAAVCCSRSSSLIPFHFLGFSAMACLILVKSSLVEFNFAFLS